MKKILLFCIVGYSILLMACIKNGNNALIYFPEMEEIKEMRATDLMNATVVDIGDYIYPFAEDEPGLSKAEIELLFNYNPVSQHEAFISFRKISNTQALEDIEHLFKLLKYSYGPYQFFGGDVVFEKAKHNIIEEINLIEDMEISSDMLETILSKNLSFINDGHL